MAAALRDLEVKLRVHEETVDLPCPIDARSLAIGCNYTFRTRLGEDFDILGEARPIGARHRLMANHEVHGIYGDDAKTIGLDDLIAVTRHIAREKDSGSLYELLAVKRVREGRGRR